MDSKMERWGISSNDVSEVVKWLFKAVDLSSDKRVVYFHGWSSFGVAPVLHWILQEPTTIPELNHRLIYIDCSEWKNRRSLQRKIAKELNLDETVVGMFDKQDEDDDFSGVDQASRDLIRNVSVEINKILRECSFMIFLLNGSDEELDLTNFGVPSFTTFAKNIMIWSFKRRLLTIEENDLCFNRLSSAQLRYTQCFVEAEDMDFNNLLREEASSIVARHPCIRDIDLTTVIDCCLYELFLCYSFHSTTEFAWAAHACNFWICDGIIKGDHTKEICNALYPEIRWNCDDSMLGAVCQGIMQNDDQQTPFVVISGDTDYSNKPACRWVSLTSKNLNVQVDQDMKIVMKKASSLFIAFKRTIGTPAGLPDCLFKHCSNLGVLVLFSCAFSFASPPFLQCHKLRFLGLERCTDNLTREGDGCTDWECLYNLLVLDLRYTSWDEILSDGKIKLMGNLIELCIEGFVCWQYISQLQMRLPYLERLRIIRPMQEEKLLADASNAFLDKKKLEILDLSGNSDMKKLPTSISNANRLQVLILDGCHGLENVDELPSSLASFSMDGYGPVSHWTSAAELPPESSRPKHPSDQDNKDVKTSKIDLRGCTQLSNLFLRSLSNLIELDLSGSALKILDFNSMVMNIPRLKRLFLLGCQHLVAIKWGSTESQPELEFVCIDTRPGTWTQPSPAQQLESVRTLQLHAILTDARLARSLWNIIYDRRSSKLAFDIHTGTSSDVQVEAATSNEAIIQPSGVVVQNRYCVANRYTDVLAKTKDALDPLMEAFPKPPERRLDRHVEITGSSRILESELRNNRRGLGGLMKYYVKSLHVHDVSIRVSMPAGQWGLLTWCRVERCPSLEGAFFLMGERGQWEGFAQLEVIWVSELAMVRYLFSNDRELELYEMPYFQCLRYLYLRSCPRLQYALPRWGLFGLPNLEIIHIIRCGSLKHVFGVGGGSNREFLTRYGMDFPALTTIHLYDLPMLTGICEVKTMEAPKLKAIRIRGCFNLRRLPTPVETAWRHTWHQKSRPTVEVEKDVWDALEWDGADTGHHACYYEPPVHSRHYRRRNLLRRSVLR